MIRRGQLAALLAAVSSAAAVAAGPRVEVLQAGVANVLPLGRHAGMEVHIDPGTLEPGTYLLEWETRTPDGDTVARSRPVPLAGAPVSVWISGLVPRTPNRPMTVSLRRADDLSLLDAASVSIADPGVLPLGEGAELMLVVGDRAGGLEDYDAQATATLIPWSTIETFVRTIEADALPDNAASLTPASTILVTGSPLDISAASREALRAWLEAGGHLIVSLSAVGDPWGIRGSQPVWPDLLDAPSESTTAAFRTLARTISPDPLTPLEPGRLPITVFPDAVAPNAPWHRILDAPNGSPIAVARPVGHGRLTLLGLDVASPALARYVAESDQTGPLPTAGRFWNPILGRRGDALTPRQRRIRVQGGAPQPVNLAAFPLQDGVVNGGIRQMVAAGGRLTLVFGWLIAWLLVGGPILWWSVHRLGRAEVAWLAFGALGLTCGAAAWAIAGSMSLSGIEGRHLTIVDEVAHTPVQRVRSWVDLRIPGGGRRDVGIGGIEEMPARIDAWAARSQDQGAFMDTRLLRTDAGSSNLIPMQARATSQSFALERFDYPDSPDDGPWLRSVTPVTTYKNSNGDLCLRGQLQNGLAEPLRDVTILWVESRRPPRGDDDPASMPVNAWTWSLADELPAGGVLDLATLPQPTSDHAIAEHLEALAAGQHRTFGSMASTAFRRDGLELLGLYRLTPPPPWRAADDTTGRETNPLTRLFGADLDIGPSFASPMLLVTGYVENTPLPTSLFVDGDEINPPQGETLLRWRTSLPDAAPRPDPFPRVR